MRTDWLTLCVYVLQIALRNMKSIELRVSGSVEHPHVDISLVGFSEARKNVMVKLKE